MKQLIAGFVVIFLLYGCSTFNNRNAEFELLKKRVDVLENMVKTNSVNIKNNTMRITDVERQLLIIKERLKKERQQDGFSDKIPPISEIIGTTNNDNATEVSIKDNTVTSVTNPTNTDTVVRKKAKKKKIKEGLNKTVSIVSDSQNDNATLKISRNYKQYYKKALSTYMKGDYKHAEYMFETFIKTYKNNDLDDNAIFWLAHSYLHLGKKKQAVKAFKELINKYPFGSVSRGGKTDAALYDLIKIYSNDKIKADYYKKILFERFPESRYAVIVKKTYGG